MSAGIRYWTRLQLLGDILGLDSERNPTSAMRLRLMQRGFSWQALVDLAMAQDVLLPLIFALTARRLLLPVPRSSKNSDSHVTAKLGKYYAQHLAQQQLKTRQLETIISVLNHAGIEPLILKGARYLIEPVASWCEARSMYDFDLLLRLGDADRAVAILKTEGYRQLAMLGYHHHLPALECPGGSAPLEIHTDALSFAGQNLKHRTRLGARHQARQRFIFRYADQVARGARAIAPSDIAPWLRPTTPGYPRPVGVDDARAQVLR